MGALEGSGCEYFYRQPEKYYKPVAGKLEKFPVKYKSVVKTNKMVSAKSFDQNGYIFGETVFFEGLKNNTWYDAVIDVPFGAGVGNDDGRYFGIIGTDLIGR